MKAYKNILTYIALAVVLILYLRECTNNSTTGNPTDTTIEVSVDSSYTKGVEDTTRFDSVEIEIKWLNPETEYETIFLHDTIHDTLYVDSVNVFKTLYSDSLIKGSITTVTTGKVISTDLKYTPKFPKYITRVDTFRIDSTTTITKTKWGLYAGAIIGGNENKFSIQPSILLKTNKGFQFSAGYGLMDKTYNFGIFTVIKNPFKK